MKYKKIKIYSVIWSNIRKYQYLNKLTNTDLAELLEISERTLFTYDKEPSRITLEKVQLFLEKTDTDIENFIDF